MEPIESVHITYTKGTVIALTFQKLFVSFPKENNHQADIKYCPSWLGKEESFSL